MSNIPNTVNTSTRTFNTLNDSYHPVSIWRAPRLTRLWQAVWMRNFLVWKKLALPSIIGNIADPLIALIAFGYGLGSLVGKVQGIDYVLFIASGYAATSVMNAASFEALYSAFSRMQIQRTWESILFTPVQLDDVVFAELLWAASKALLTGIVMLVVIVAFGISREPTLMLAPLALFLAGCTFAALGLVFNALAKGYDFFTYYFTLFMTPMVFLSGMFFPLTQMPAWLQSIAQWLPLTASIELVRPLLLGHLPAAPWRNIALLLAYGEGGYYIALVLTRKRFAL